MKIFLKVKESINTDNIYSSVKNVKSLDDRCSFTDDGEYIINIENSGHFNSVILEEVVDYICNDLEDIDYYIVPHLIEVSESQYDFANFQYPKETMSYDKFIESISNNKHFNNGPSLITKSSLYGKDFSKIGKYKFIDTDWIYYTYLEE